MLGDFTGVYKLEVLGTGQWEPACPGREWVRAKGIRFKVGGVLSQEREREREGTCVLGTT